VPVAEVAVAMLHNQTEDLEVQVVVVVVGVIIIQSTHRLMDSINRQPATMLALVLIIPAVAAVEAVITAATHTELAAAVVRA
jgi:uncharacterized protein (DUF983 family)